MPYEELLGWYNYFERRPVGWRSDDRTAKLLQVQGVKQKPSEIFSSLITIYNSSKPKKDKGLNKSLLFQKMLSAKKV